MSTTQIYMSTATARKAPEKELEKYLREAQKTYDDGAPIIDDAHFDALLEILRGRFPRNKWLNSAVKAAPATLSNGDKITLPVYLPSLDKIKPGGPGKDNLADWARRHPCPNGYIVSIKLDGISGLLIGGREFMTQGDGITGFALVSHLKYMQGHDERIPPPADTEGMTVRGEIIIPKKRFAAYNAHVPAGQKAYKAARNLAAGIANNKKPPAVLLALLDYVPYEVIKPEGLTPEEGFAALEAAGFTMPEWRKVRGVDLTDAKATQMLHEMVDAAPWECDGIVIAANIVTPRRVGANPTYAIAFKLPKEGEESVVERVEWNVSKYGILFPTVVIEPIVIDNIEIQRASGKNARFIVGNGIGPGAVVRVARGGDVIPDIRGVITPAKARGDALLPPAGTWEWGPISPTDGVPVHIVATHPDESREFHIARLTTFFVKLDTDGVSEGTVTKLYDAGYTTLPEILGLEAGDISGLSGFGATSAANIVTGIHRALKKARRPQLMVASCIFGHGMGETKTRLILEAFPNLDELIGRVTVEDWSGVRIPSGISLATLVEFVGHLEEYKEWLDDSLAPFLAYPGQGWIPEPIAVAAAGKAARRKSIAGPSLAGMSFVFTGFRDGVLEEMLVARGAHIASSVSRKVTAVVAKEPERETGKVKAAIDAGIPVMGISEFRAKYKV